MSYIFSFSYFSWGSQGNSTEVDTIKDRNGMDLTEAENIKERWQEYTEELYRKDLMTQIITMA